MKLHFVQFIIAVAIACLAVKPVSAQTQGHTYVASTGSGTACSRALPCGNAATALNATTAGGVITILDAGDTAALVINKSVTIRAIGVDAGSNSDSRIGGPWISVSAGPNDLVTLEGLHLAGGAITFLSGGHLQVLNCTIGDQTTSDAGIRFQPNSASRLTVSNTFVKNMGSGTGGGIVVNPRAGGSARVSINRSEIAGGAFGIAADGSNSTGGINMTIADSLIGNAAQDGVIATTPAGGAPIGVALVNSQSVNNAIGVRSLGPNVTVRLQNSSVFGNGTGLAFGGGGALLTFGNNAVQANGTNGSFSGSVGLQ